MTATTAARRAKPTMSEDDLLRAVLDMCRRLSLRTAHFRPALSKSGRWMTAVQGDGKGWPDLTIVGPGGVLFRELKAEGKYPEPEQRLWLEALTVAGANVGVWKPHHLTEGLIEQQLKALRKPTDLTGETHG